MTTALTALHSAPHCFGLPCTIYSSILQALEEQGGCFTASKGCQQPQATLVAPMAVCLWLSRMLNCFLAP